MDSCILDQGAGAPASPTVNALVAGWGRCLRVFGEQVRAAGGHTGCLGQRPFTKTAKILRYFLTIMAVSMRNGCTSLWYRWLRDCCLGEAWVTPFSASLQKNCLKCSEVAVLFSVFSSTVSNSILPSDLGSNKQINKQTDIAQGVGPKINASQLASLLISESA